VDADTHGIRVDRLEYIVSIDHLSSLERDVELASWVNQGSNDMEHEIEKDSSHSWFSEWH
jgi:hypothetical protein